MDKFFVNGGCSTNKQYFSGVGKCDLAEGVTDYLLIGRSSAVLTVPENGDLTQAVKAALALPFDDANKLWLIGKITTNNAPEGGDMVTNTKGTRGGSITTGQNPISIAYAFPAGVCMYNQLSKFNGMECRVFRIDRNKNLFGVGELTIDANNVITETLKGFAAALWISNTPEADGGDVEMITVNVSYGVDYFTTELPNRSNGLVTETLVALNPVKIAKATPLVAENAAFSIKYNCSGEKLDSATLNLLIDDDCYEFTNVTSIALSVNANNDIEAVVTAVDATKDITVKLQSPDVLETAGIVGIEGFDEAVVIKAGN